jgi:hypothetical protein
MSSYQQCYKKSAQADKITNQVEQNVNAIVELCEILLNT